MSIDTIYLIAGFSLALLLLPAIAGATTARNTLEEKEDAYYGGFIRQYAAMYGAPAKRIAAIIIHESRVDSNATGTNGDRGLMQVTARALADVNSMYGLNISYDELYDAETNIKAGTAFFALQIRRVGGDIGKATQAYNAGAKAVLENPDASLAYRTDVERIERTLISF